MTEMQKAQLVMSAFFVAFLFLGIPKGGLGLFIILITGGCFLLTVFQVIGFFLKRGLSKGIRWVKRQ